MKKKIAVYANGWSDEYLQTVLLGIRECARERHVDVFVFVEFSAGVNVQGDTAEINIIKLAELDRFDGAIFLTNTYNLPSMQRYFAQEVKRTGIPAVSFEYELEGVDYIGTENYEGMYELTAHMIDVHGAKEILFVGGQPEHTESQIRHKAVETAMADRGLTLTKDYVVYGFFSDIYVQGVIREWVENHKKLPDVIICANDVMAMGVCLWLQKNGYTVPEDVAVTGYDYIQTAQLCYPSITSVGRDWDRLGYNGLSHVLDKIEGKPVVDKVSMRSHFQAAESCGCAIDTKRSKRANISYSAYGKKRESMDFDSHNRALYSDMREIDSYEKLRRVFRRYFTQNSSYEGKNFAICTELDFWKDSVEASALRQEGYSETMGVLVDFVDGKAVDKETFQSAELVPDYHGEDEAHIYILVPLHNADAVVGYAVFQDQESVIKDGMLYTWTRHMNQCMEQARQNIRLAELNRRLQELSVTDALTGIYNRLGYEKLALPYLEKCRDEGRKGVMIFADVNRMKVINDRYGHLQGDNALRAVACALKKSLPDDWIVVRYGGDEFLAAGACDDQEQVDALEKEIYDRLQQEVVERNMPFGLSVSVGAVWVDGDALSIEECFKKADESMYRMKTIQHGEESS